MGLILLALYQVPTASTFSAVGVVRGRPLPGTRSMDPVVRNRFLKSSTPRLLHFLSRNSLIDRFTRTFLIPRHFYGRPM